MAALALQGAKWEGSKKHLEPPLSLLQQISFLLFVSTGLQWVYGSWQQNLQNHEAASREYHLKLREITLLITFISTQSTSSSDINCSVVCSLYRKTLLCFFVWYLRHNFNKILILISYFIAKSILIFNKAHSFTLKRVFHVWFVFCFFFILKPYNIITT